MSDVSPAALLELLLLPVVLARPQAVVVVAVIVVFAVIVPAAVLASTSSPFCPCPQELRLPQKFEGGPPESVPPCLNSAPTVRRIRALEDRHVPLS